MKPVIQNFLILGEVKLILQGQHLIDELAVLVETFKILVFMLVKVAEFEEFLFIFGDDFQLGKSVLIHGFHIDNVNGNNFTQFGLNHFNEFPYFFKEKLLRQPYVDLKKRNINRGEHNHREFVFVLV